MLHVNNIECHYKETPVFTGISFNIEANSSACLLGPSGCGKTTVLRAIAGFEPILNGQIALGDRILCDKHHSMPPEKRKVGMVFQDYALFPHLSNYDNVGFGLVQMDKKQRHTIVMNMLELVGLEDQAARYPHQLSGGQQQRIALARAIAPTPDLLLLDEPFSNLDTELRQHLNLEVKRILKSQNMAYLLVTHDQHEAFAMADQIGVMVNGRIQQWDTPYNLYHQPSNTTVANFIGDGVLINGDIVDGTCIQTAAGKIISKNTLKHTAGQKVKILLRPDDIVPAVDSTLSATIIDKAFKGAVTQYHMVLPNGETIKGLFPSHNDYQVGQQVNYDFAIDHLIVFPDHDSSSIT